MSNNLESKYGYTGKQNNTIYLGDTEKAFKEGVRVGQIEELELFKTAINKLKNGKVADYIDNPEFDYEYYIQDRLEELKGLK